MFTQPRKMGMKKISLLILCAGLAVAQSGCVECASHDDCGNYTAAPSPEAWYAQPTSVRPRVWYRMRHRIWDDGYSFSNDPADPDVLRPALGIDTYYPPAPLPYKSID
jgi:hypothetical protein